MAAPVRTIGFLLLASVAVLALSLSPFVASATRQDVYPGQRLLLPAAEPGAADSWCTLGFIFHDGAGAKYVGTAGHCFGRAGDASRVGERAYVPDPDHVNARSDIGQVVYWVVPPSGTATVDWGLDLALIRLDDAARANPKVALGGVAHQGGVGASPTGSSEPDDVRAGDLVLLSGHAVAFDASAITQRNRGGTALSQTTDFYCMAAATLHGDSGGPVVHAGTGKAIGFIDTLIAFDDGSPGACSGYAAGATVDAVERELADRFPGLALETA